ncbi:MAG TPA: host specificity protein [Rhizobiales bacterium]|nr:host specificity protein [Hyphomicrobiales bacterium]
MATIVLQAAGAFLGGFLGSTGAALGTAAGAVAGYVLDQALINSTRHIEGARLTSAPPFTAEDGAPLPRLYGTARLGGTLIWATRFEEVSTTTRQGFKGGPRVTEYSYYANVAFALCEGEISGVRRIWADGRELDRTLHEIRVYRGTEDQDPDPLIAAKQGADNAPAYRGTAYVVFERFALEEYGNRIPQFQFETIRAVGTVAGNVRAVCLIPGATEYGLSPTPVTRMPGDGETVSLNRHVLHGETDLAAALDELQALCPNLAHVGLVVTWFGTDLRAGQCRIRPALADIATEGLSKPWRAAGLDRADAETVSQAGGGAAYGGTPSDRSVIEAIAEIRTRGLGVTLYPFVMMDIPADNELPDPYGGAVQAPYPWRGRITCDPAPGEPGTADATAAARAQVEAFCGDATAAAFATAGGEVTYSGPADDWGYRRFVLHMARLAALAGGVDAFVIGSELRGLSTLRDGTGAYPFVEQLCNLAAEARTLLGEATKITYGADWSEYSGHRPQDGSGDVSFHLDPLWAHGDIDAVGIDNYMPLSDWRDGDYAGGNPDGFSGPYDPAGLRRFIAGGEGFDWYYASAADRAARLRTPIEDDAHGKPWVHRTKDLVAWWSNEHHDRVGGVEAATPTAWQPRGKPIWFTELGCPAVDKGPNQPNVFPDPKSSENAIPHFSSGGRSDLAQHRFIAAHQAHWDPAADGFEPAANPASDRYDGLMVDPERIYLWAWDARPFPAFPLIGAVWRDGGNWATGHWLNGRLGGATAGDLVQAILADHDLPAADTGAADGTLHGYVIQDPRSARAALEPVVDLFGLSAFEDGGVLHLAGESAFREPILADVLVADGDTVFRAERTPDHHLPTEVSVAFHDPLRDYQACTARAVRLGVEGVRQETVAFPGAMAAGTARSLAEDRLRRLWAGRDTVAFDLPPAAVGVAPGRSVRLPGHAGDAEFLVEAVEQGLVRRITARRIVRAVPTADVAEVPADKAAPAVFGAPAVQFLDLPMPPGGEAPERGLRIAAWARPWRSQAIHASPEATGFVRRAIATRAATTGVLVEPLSPGYEGRVLRGAALVVRLNGGALSSVSRARLLNGANVAAVRSLTGVWEVLQFESAAEIAASVWRLTDLLRGQSGTGDGAAAGAAAGAAFVLLDDAVVAAGLAASEIGLLLRWRVGPSGRDLSAAQCVEQEIAGGVRARTPLSPVHIRAARSAGGDWSVSWIRRGRIDADSWDGAEIPLGERSESYRVDIGPPGGPVLRSATADETNWIYAAADLAADFASLPAEAEVTVRQLGAGGWGLPGVARMTFD